MARTDIDSALATRAGNCLLRLRSEGTNAAGAYVSLAECDDILARALLTRRTRELGFDSVRAMLLRQPHCGKKTAAWLVATYLGGSEVEPSLVAPPWDYALAETGLLSSIAVRAGQLLAIARLRLRDELAQDVPQQATARARLPTVQAHPVSPFSHAQHVAKSGALLGEQIRRSLATYAREYDEVNRDDLVRADARLFLAALAKAVAPPLPSDALSDMLAEPAKH